MLNGHLDTVGVEGMADAVHADRRRRPSSGAGPSDMKGGVAAMVAAAEELVAPGCRAGSCWPSSPTRRTPAWAARRSSPRCRRSGIRPDVAVVAEPTWLAIGREAARLRRGARSIRRPGGPQLAARLGVNAVTHLGRLLAAVEARAAELAGRRWLLMVTVACGGDSPFVLPAWRGCLVERRTVPGEAPTPRWPRSTQLLAGLRAADATVDATARLVVAREAWRLDADGPGGRPLGDPRLRSPTPPRGRCAATFDAPYWMEAPLWQAACPTLVCGPSGGGLHAADEWVDLDRCARTPTRCPAVARWADADVPTDPRRLRGDAPLLDAWLRFQEDAPDAVHHPRPQAAPRPRRRRRRRRRAALRRAGHHEALARGPRRRRGARRPAVGRRRLPVLGRRRRPTPTRRSRWPWPGDGDRVVVGRTLHRSMLLGLVLAGLDPVWVRPEVDPDPRAAARASRPRPSRPRSPAHPTPGRCSSATRPTSARSATWAALADGRARGTASRSSSTPRGRAHFGFHPALPPHALAAGADALVTSAHKTLPAWSQAALVLARTAGSTGPGSTPASRRPPTTSPAGAILASIDAARALLERDGEALLGPVIEAVATARERLARVRRARRARRPRGRPDAADPRARPAPAPTATPSRPTCWPAGCRSRWPTATPSSRW